MRKSRHRRLGAPSIERLESRLVLAGDPITFTFEDLAPQILTAPLSITKSGLVVDISRSGSSYNVWPVEGVSSMGTRALTPAVEIRDGKVDFVPGDTAPFLVNFSRPISRLSVEMGDSGSDNPDILTVSLFSLPDGKGTRVGTATVNLPHRGETTFTSAVVQANAVSARSAVIVGGTPAYPNSTFLDNISVDLATALAPTGTVSGRVSIHRSLGATSAPNDSNAASVIVYVDANGDGLRDVREVSATTKSDGTFVLPGLLPGTLMIRVADPEGRIPHAPTSGYQRVTIAAGESRAGVDFSLKAESPLRLTAMSPKPGDTNVRGTAVITVSFDSDVDPATRWGGVFRLVGAGGDSVFGDGNDRTYNLIASNWDAATRTMRLDVEQGWLPPDKYYFTATDELFNTDGNALDGEYTTTLPSGNGAPGGHFSTTFVVTTSPPVPVPFAGKAIQNDSTILRVTVTDPETDVRSIEVVRSPRNGTLMPTGKIGEFLYTPTSGFVGADDFIFRGIDQIGAGPEGRGVVYVAAAPVDFVPRSLTVTGSGALAVGRSATLNWTVDNRGLGTTIAASWSDDFYLSHDAVLDRDDVLIASCNVDPSQVAPGKSYSATRKVTLPFGEWVGDVYVLTVAHANGGQLERVTANNTLATPVRLSPAIEITTPAYSFAGRENPFVMRWRDAVPSSGGKVTLAIDTDPNPMNGIGAITLQSNIDGSGDGSLDRSTAVIPATLKDGDYFIWAKMETQSGTVYSPSVPIKLFQAAYPGEDERSNATGGGSYEVYGVDLAVSEGMLNFRVRTNFSPSGNGGDLYVNVGGSRTAGTGNTVAIGLRNRTNATGQSIELGGVYQGVAFQPGSGRRDRPIFADNYLTRSTTDARVTVTATQGKPWSYEASGKVSLKSLSATSTDSVEVGWGMYCGNDFSETKIEKRPVEQEPRRNLLGTGFVIGPADGEATGEAVPSFRWGSQTRIAFSVVNQGNAPVAPTRVRIVFSADSTITKEDRSLSIASGSIDVPGLAVGASFTGNVEVTLPAEPPAGLNAGGNVCLGMIVDSSDAVAESDEGDNLNFGRGLDKAELRIGRAKIVNVLIHGYAVPGIDTSLFASTTAGPMEDRYELYGQMLLAYAATVPSLKDQVDYYVTRWKSDLGFSPALIDVAAYRICKLIQEGDYEPDLPTTASETLRESILTKLKEAVIDEGLGAIAEYVFLTDAARCMERARALAMAAATTTVRELTQSATATGGLSKLGPPGEGQWIHVVGHSRGGAVGAEVVRQLTAMGYRVARYTGLDGFSVDWPDGDKMPDLDIVGTLRQGSAATMINYRVEEGLSQYVDSAALEFLRSKLGSWVPEIRLGQYFTDDNGDPMVWRAPTRAPLLNDILMKAQESFGLAASNHINVTDYFFSRHPNPEVAEKNPYAAMLDAVSTWTFGSSRSAKLSPRSIVTPLALNEDAFVDGTFEKVGALTQSVARLKSLGVTGDPTIDVIWQRLLSSDFGVDSFIKTDGQTRIVNTNGNTLVEIGGASSIGLTESIQLSAAAGFFGFRVTAASASVGDELIVRCNDMDIARIGLKELVGKPLTTYWCNIQPHAGRTANFSMAIDGPTSKSSVVRFDDFRILAGKTASAGARPSIGLLDDRVLFSKATPSVTIPLQITDADTPLSRLRIAVTSDNLSILPRSGVKVTWRGGVASLQLTPRPGMNGLARVTVSVSDGGIDPDRKPVYSRSSFGLRVVSGQPLAAPTNLVVNGGQGSVRLTWDAVLSQEVIDYVVESRRSGTTEWRVEPDGVRKTTGAQFAGFLNGGRFCFRVSARTSSFDGTPTWSKEVEVDAAPETDLNGDGIADVSLQQLPGQFTALLLDAGTKSLGMSATHTNTGCSVVSTGDFDGNGITDLVWRRTSDNSHEIWLLGPGGNVLSQRTVTKGARLRVEGTGDFDGDGREDLLFRDADSKQVAVYCMNGSTPQHERFLGGSLTNRPVAVSPRFDADGDGTTDLVWRDSLGRYRVWLMEKGQPERRYSIPQIAGLEVVGGDDFDGDGKGDVIWWNGASNTYAVGILSGASVVGTANLPFGRGDRVSATKDADGDGKADILWCSPDGRAFVSFMDGLRTLRTKEIELPVGASVLPRPGRVVTTISLPRPPVSLTVTAGKEAVALTWSAPVSDGGSPITDYVIRFKGINASAWSTFDDGVSTRNTAVVTGLASGTAYVFKVIAVNVRGFGEESTQSAASTPFSVPSAPSILQVTPGNGQVPLEWVPPASDGSATITDYQVSYSVNAGATWSPAVSMGRTLSGTVAGLINGVGYVFRVVAINAAGGGPHSASSAAVIPQMPTTMVLFGDEPEGARTTRTSLSVRLLDGNGNGVAGQPIYFAEYWNWPGNTKVSKYLYNNYGYSSDVRNWKPVVTDINGTAVLKYIIPPSTSADFVRLLASFGGTAGLSASAFSISKLKIYRS